MKTGLNKSKNGLFDLVATSMDVTRAIIEAGGEVNAEIEKRMAEVDFAIASKVDGYKVLVDRLEAEAEYWTREAAARAKIAKTLERLAKIRKDAIKAAMIQLEKQEAVGLEYVWKLSRGGDKLVIDAEKLPPEYLMVIPASTQPDRERIEKALKSGTTIVGAKLEEFKMLRVSINKGE